MDKEIKEFSFGEDNNEDNNSVSYDKNMKIQNNKV